MDFIELGNTGIKASVLGYGAAGLGRIYGTSDEARGIRAVRQAIDSGINLIDTSPLYGGTKSESLLGKALRGIPRDSYYLATKVGRYKGGISDFSVKRIVRSMDESLQRLGMNYVDFFQCHDIDFVPLDQIVDEALPALRKLQKQGKTRFVGITGFPLKIYRYVLDRTDLDTVLSFCHYMLNDTTLKLLVPYLQRKGVGIINASPLGMGLFTERGPAEWHPATSEIKRACAKAVQFCRNKGENISKLAIQHSLRNPSFATTLIGTTRPDNVKKNVKWAESHIDEDLLEDVLEVLRPIRDKSWARGLAENN